ncbi:NAD(P)/FAD-dependent oxidoreductase [Burkholderia sp. Ac-20379]|uniref:NAD(P)/FAD-dependent oxidoreductase n=1 Tax=Burkholderia sp. Ac-20379 TaxID=2703900 RepID=UPI00197D03B1|nr:NAD(P)/FAD-dependent oxidoreductase [Burkholderia sp. Ac-20379]MBN3728958.1 NAD(P)/FAD-dependent oxidoreductase [Burkholderia sp. Ac-20379]
MSKRILVIGAGFAGMWSALSAARLLDLRGRTDIEITLVAPAAELHVRPRLYENDPGAMRAPLQPLFDAVGVRFVAGRVEAIDVARREVSVSSAEAGAEPQRLGYDRLVLAAGSRLFRPEIPGLVPHAFNVDQVEDAAALEAHLHALAARPAGKARNTVVVAGAGFTGIETAAELPARLRAILGEAADVDVILIDREAELGPDLGPGPRPVITRALTELGVRWKLGSGVAFVDAQGVTLANGERIDAQTVVWTAGARASALTAQVPGEHDRFGRLHVDRNLKVTGVEAVYATGDCAYAATDEAGNHAAMSCQHAMNLGRSAGHNAAADLLGEAPLPYSQPKYVTCLDLGPWGAVYTEGWDRVVKMEGAQAKALKTQINSEWIYPPAPNRAEALAAADPQRIVVA